MTDLQAIEVIGPATRREGQRRLAAFLPRAGRAYARDRNYDLGPGDRSNVSTLSPFLRHRLVLEEEVVASVLDHHGQIASEKFLQEVCWRTYWKGWLELRPQVWSSYRQRTADLIGSLDRDQSLRSRYEEAIEGRTGIACVDSWARELVETGYLHNHARMWFASIWIFTLHLPWQLGADFFYRHLLDGDPASNTLSWRWVGGLQTRGKTYLARPDNIAAFTLGRFHPKETLAQEAPPLTDEPCPSPRALPPAGALDNARLGLLLTEEDLHSESLMPSRCEVSAIGGLLAIQDRSPLGTAPPAANFTVQALADGLDRAQGRFGLEARRLDDSDWNQSVISWAREHDLCQIATAYTPIGPAQERLDQLDEALSQIGVRLVRLRRRWDETLWPHARAGFFSFKERIGDSLKLLSPRSDR